MTAFRACKICRPLSSSSGSRSLGLIARVASRATRLPASICSRADWRRPMWRRWIKAMTDRRPDRVVIINDRSAKVGGASNLAILSADLLARAGIAVTYFAGDTSGDERPPANSVRVPQLMRDYFVRAGRHTKDIETVANPAEALLSMPASPWQNHDFFFIGGLEPEKGFEDAARAARLAGVRLCVIGDGAGR